MSGQKKKNFQIEAFKHHVVIDPKYADKTWKILEHAIHEIYNQNASGLSFEELYSTSPQTEIVGMEDHILEHNLFGGTITARFPQRLQDLSIICPVPDHQEVFADPSHDESLIFELLDLKEDVADDGSATHFFLDLAYEQDAGGVMVMEQSGVFVADWLCFQQVPSVITTVVGQMNISKGRQGREAQNTVRVYLANIRLKGVTTDVLITANEPLFINSTAATVCTRPHQSTKAMHDIFKLAVSSFTVKDWNLFATPT